MSKWGTDENGWPLVPVDPKAIPKGYEPVRVSFPKSGELSVNSYGETHCWRGCVDAFDPPRLIIRPAPKPIRLPTSIVPHGWWVAKDMGVYVYEYKPKIEGDYWGATCGDTYCIPPWIAAQLPAEWHELPWDQSAVQQTEGGEG